VADAVEALGQHVHQEAPDKLVRVKPHRLPHFGDRKVDAAGTSNSTSAPLTGQKSSLFQRLALLL
jgi:hypothetical protein